MRVVRRMRFAWGPWEMLERRLLYSAAPYVIDGVQPASLDQPQIHGYFTTTPGGAPLSADDGFGNTSFDVQAFLDTGTSEVLLSQETAQGLGIPLETVNGTPVNFVDIGVGGGQNFNVSQPVYGGLAPSTPNADVDNQADFQSVYNQTFGPLRAEVNTQPADEIVGPLDIFGMPVMQGKVMVMDPRPLNDPNNIGQMNTYLYTPGTPYDAANNANNPGVVPTTYHVKLSYASFAAFTSTDPPGATPPDIAANPFIGPDPVAQLNPHAPPDDTPPVTIGQGSLTSTGSFLFDSGAASSFISQAEASAVGVHYKAGTYGSSNPVLVDGAGNPVPNQFTEQIGGIGNPITAAGFFLDSLTLPTIEGTPITFTHAPVLVFDVTATNPTTNRSVTLDGDFGMNFLVASANVDQNGNFLATNAGPWDWVTFDQSNGLLGFQPAGSPVQANLNNVVQGTPGLANTITLKKDASSGKIDVWVNAPETAAPAQLADPSVPIFISGGGGTDSLVLDTSNGSPIGTKLILHGSFTTGALSIGAGQTVALDQSVAGAGTLSVTSLNVATGGTLDLGDNLLKITYPNAAADPNARIQSLIQAGRNGGRWTGAGITSAEAASNPQRFGVGAIDQKVSRTELVRGTFLGDANLDGRVDVVDLGVLATNFGATSGATWATGDFNGDGKVDVADLGVLATNFSGVIPAAPTSVSNPGPALLWAASSTPVAQAAASVASGGRALLKAARPSTIRSSAIAPRLAPQPVVHHLATLAYAHGTRRFRSVVLGRLVNDAEAVRPAITSAGAFVASA